MKIYFDQPTSAFIRIKSLSPEELTKFYGEDLTNKITNSKSGYITITKDNQVHKGLCVIFTEGLSCYLCDPDYWYRTSNIQEIDWDKQEFKTLNSTYKFNLEEIPFNDLKSMYYDTSKG